MENLTVRNLEELEGLKRPQLVELMKNFKAEDTDCLEGVNGRSKNDELIEALAEYMGFMNAEAEEQAVTEEVQKEITEQSGVTEDESEENYSDEMDSLFGPQPTESEEVAGEVGQLAETPEESTGDEEVDSVLAELGLDGGSAVNMDDILFDDSPEAEAQVEAENEDMAKKLDEFKNEKAEEKPKKKRNTVPMNAPIPVRNFRNLILGIYGNILEPLEEKDDKGFEYEELKLERFNAKAHETFRSTKGNMTVLYTSGGGAYLIAHELPSGEFEPVLEVTNRGRGNLRCKQIANVLQLAFNEKKDNKIIEDTLYQELAEKIELQEIKWEGLGA
jgi:hypothetical protein